jgi:RNA polymerase sigma-70 factor (ECF subfamily)
VATDHPDPKRPELDVLWASEGEGYLINKALQQVREKVSEKQYLIYEMHVLREVPISTVVANLQTSTMAVYVAKHRVGKLLRVELGKLRHEEDPE